MVVAETGGEPLYTSTDHAGAGALTRPALRKHRRFSVGLLIFAKCTSIFSNHTDFFSLETRILDCFTKKRIFILLVVSGNASW